ncbi:hypothetical protein HELRODRAFT_168371 [Helobdella robusta]|uniref:Uncharacterized protein n=1 Tax=Helobdella robusta TaxID=6412 RepID=T1F0H9_HELRO|nr:hypothetical protein HELRODRAFT_168371 [Helobdella robusta]ESO09390.1 hypothetical protein HELRODRAFT_168371 [Helobdella robusta]
MNQKSGAEDNFPFGILAMVVVGVAIGIVVGGMFLCMVVACTKTCSSNNSQHAAAEYQSILVNNNISRINSNNNNIISNNIINNSTNCSNITNSTTNSCKFTEIIGPKNANLGARWPASNTEKIAINSNDQSAFVYSDECDYHKDTIYNDALQRHLQHQQLQQQQQQQLQQQQQQPSQHEMIEFFPVFKKHDFDVYQYPPQHIYDTHNRPPTSSLPSTTTINTTSISLLLTATPTSTNPEQLLHINNKNVGDFSCRANYQTAGAHIFQQPQQETTQKVDNKTTTSFLYATTTTSHIPTNLNEAATGSKNKNLMYSPPIRNQSKAYQNNNNNLTTAANLNASIDVICNTHCCCTCQDGGVSTFVGNDINMNENSKCTCFEHSDTTFNAFENKFLQSFQKLNSNNSSSNINSSSNKPDLTQMNN